MVGEARWRRRVDETLHAAAAWLALAFLVALAVVLPQLASHRVPLGVVRWAGVAAIAIWAAMAVELLVRVAWLERGRGSRRRGAYEVGCLLVPPLRLGLTAMGGRSRRLVWLPGVGWRRSGRALVRHLQRRFSGPMIVIGLMVLPALALEFLYKDQLDARPTVALGLDIGLRLIWLAFAIELVVMLAASREKLTYARQHWVDLAIVLFPLISFLRVLRLLRLGSVVRASRLATMARTYRLRGLAMRLMRAVLLLRVLERMSERATRARIRMLEGSIEKHQRQIHEASEEIAELRTHLEKRRRDKGGIGEETDAGEAGAARS